MHCLIPENSQKAPKEAIKCHSTMRVLTRVRVPHSTPHSTMTLMYFKCCPRQYLTWYQPGPYTTGILSWEKTQDPQDICWPFARTGVPGTAIVLYLWYILNTLYLNWIKGLLDLSETELWCSREILIWKREINNLILFLSVNFII